CGQTNHLRRRKWLSTRRRISDARGSLAPRDSSHSPDVARGARAATSTTPTGSPPTGAKVLRVSYARRADTRSTMRCVGVLGGPLVEVSTQRRLAPSPRRRLTPKKRTSDREHSSFGRRPAMIESRGGFDAYVFSKHPNYDEEAVRREVAKA